MLATHQRWKEIAGLHSDVEIVAPTLWEELKNHKAKFVENDTLFIFIIQKSPPMADHLSNPQAGWLLLCVSAHMGDSLP